VEALIQALKNEEESVTTRAAEALREITEEDLGPDYEDWADWHERQGETADD
jgi:hypothetical protein